MKWCWLLGLTLAAWEDLKSRQVSFLLLFIFLIPGIWNVCLSDVTEHLWAGLTGIAMLTLSKVTRGALGEGDGWFFLLSACYLDVREINILFLGSLGLGCIWGMVLMVRNWWSNNPGRLDETIPFLTCAWPIGVWLVCW